MTALTSKSFSKLGTSDMRDHITLEEFLDPDFDDAQEEIEMKEQTILNMNLLKSIEALGDACIEATTLHQEHVQEVADDYFKISAFRTILA